MAGTSPAMTEMEQLFLRFSLDRARRPRYARFGPRRASIDRAKANVRRQALWRPPRFQGAHVRVAGDRSIVESVPQCVRRFCRRRTRNGAERLEAKCLAYLRARVSCIGRGPFPQTFDAARCARASRFKSARSSSPASPLSKPSCQALRSQPSFSASRRSRLSIKRSASRTTSLEDA